MVDVVKVSNYSNNPSFKLEEEKVLKVVGTGENMKGLYESGVLNVEIEVYDGVSGKSLNYLGREVEKPSVLVDFFKYLGNSYTKCLKMNGKKYLLGLSYVSVVSEEDGNISVYLDCTEKVVKILIANTEEGLRVLEGKEYLISEVGFLGKLQDVLLWASEMSPVPMNSIEYHVAWGIDSLDMVGEGSSYYIGFAEAVEGNNLLHDVNAKGEYVVSFLEVV